MLTPELKRQLEEILTPEKKKAIAPSRPEKVKQVVDKSYHAQPGQT